MTGKTGRSAPAHCHGMRFHDPLIYWATRHPELRYSDGSRVITYSEALAITQLWLTRLSRLGIRPGDRIALVSDNDPLAPLLICATSRMGAVTVPLNPRLSGTELADLIRRSGAKVVVAGPRHAALLGEPDLIDAQVDRLCFGAEAPGWQRIEDTAGSGPVALLPYDAVRNPVAVAPFTSGTTGTPKSALVRHESFVVESIRWQTAGMRLAVGDRFYQTLPLTLAAGMCMAFHSMWSGATLVTEPFDAVTAARRIVAGEVEAIVLVPTMIHMLLDELGADKGAAPNLRWLFYGAAPMSPTLLERALRRLGCEFYQGYGATEAMAMTLLTPEDHQRALAGAEHLLASVGRPQLGCAVRVLTADGNDAEPGETGEICSIGEQVFEGYADAEQTAKAFDADGWYHTGDLGHFDGEGYLYVTDRKDNMIISGGINISPTEIESVIATIEGVSGVAVVGLPHEKWGQQVVAAIVREQGESLDESTVADHCVERLAAYKRPKSIVFVDELPYNANGKLQHSTVRARLAESLNSAATAAP